MRASEWGLFMVANGHWCILLLEQQSTMPPMSSTQTMITQHCNLYSMTKVPEAVRRLFRVSSNRAAAFEPKDAIYPGHMAPVIRRAEDGECELLELSWGFVLPQPGKFGADTLGRSRSTAHRWNSMSSRS